MTYLAKTRKHLEGVQMEYRSLKIWSIVQSIAGSLTLALQRNLKTIKFTQRCMAQGGGTGYMTRLPVDLIDAVCFPPFRAGNSKLHVHED